MQKKLGFWMSSMLIACTTAALVACGGGGVVPSTGVSTRALSADFSTRKAASYSPFRTANRDTETVTDAHVLQDLNLLSQGGFKLIRLFDSSDTVAARVLRLIDANPSLDIKVMLGAYIVSESSPYLNDSQRASNRVLNQAEVARAVALANSYRNIVAAVSVGNETMVSWSFVPSSTAVMAGYITSVRNQITQPVTTDDNWAFFAGVNTEPNDPKPILNAVDFVSVHTYPLADSLYNTWDWRQPSAVAMMDGAIAKAKADVNAVRANLDGRGFANLPSSSVKPDGKPPSPTGKAPAPAPPTSACITTAWLPGRLVQAHPRPSFISKLLTNPGRVRTTVGACSM